MPGYAGLVQHPAGLAVHRDEPGVVLAEVSLDCDALVACPDGVGVSPDVLAGGLLDQGAAGCQLHGPQGRRFLRLRHEKQFYIRCQGRTFQQQQKKSATNTYRERLEEDLLSLTSVVPYVQQPGKSFD